MGNFNVLYLIYGTVALINLAGFLTVRIDKKRSIRHQWRIPEKTFFWLAVTGGSAGVYAGCLIFRHKTKHLRFMVGLPVIGLIQIGLVTYWFHR